MTGSGAVDLVVWLGGGAAALLAIGALVRAVWRINRRVVVIVDAVQELTPNSGHSIKDKVDATAADVAAMKTTVEALTAAASDVAGRLAEHLAEHSRSRQGDGDGTADGHGR